MLARLRRVARRLLSLPIQSYYTLSGWRFADLKEHIDHSIGHDADGILAMIEAMPTRQAPTNARVAVLTCLPPDESGIANFSSKHLRRTPVAVDIYSQVRDPATFLREREVLAAGSEGRARLFPMSSLLARDAAQPYHRILYVLGNSAHNVEVFRQMETMSSYGRAAAAVCYLHDVCCHNVVQLGKRQSAAEYARFLADLYNADINRFRSLDSWQIHGAAVEAGLLGPRALSSLGVQHFIVNSKAAAELVRGDLPEAERQKVTVTELFHPVFEAEVPVAPSFTSHPLTIGSFGAAAWAKGTDVVVEAVKELRARGVASRLVLAGYGAVRFVERETTADDRNWIEAAEPKTERDLQLDMLKCDIAVQLRRNNLGESSGVVPTLLGVGIPTIVSPVGAFLEYGEAVHYFRGEDPKALADVLQHGVTPSPAAMAKYALDHSVDAFNGRLFDALGIAETRHPQMAAD